MAIRNMRAAAIISPIQISFATRRGFHCMGQQMIIVMVEQQVVQHVEQRVLRPSQQVLDTLSTCSPTLSIC
jgi:hypothetical protein